MESITIPRSAPHGGWHLETEQDFCYGAKTSSPLYSGASTPSSSLSPNYHDSPIWIEESDNFNWNNLEAFSDVLLPDVENFGPDDLFKGISDQTGDASLPTPKIWEEQIEDAPRLHTPTKPKNNPIPKITIKLKRIKKSQKKSDTSQPAHSSPQLYHTPKYELSPLSTLSMASPDQNYFFNDLMSAKNESFVASSDLENEISSWEMKDSKELDIFECSKELMESLNDVPKQSPELSDMTLKDLINYDQTSHLLDQFLDNSISSQSETDNLYVEESLESSIVNDGASIAPRFCYTSDDSSTIADEQLYTTKVKTRKTKRSHRRATSPETRQNRKKEQNKNAALRYRMKKRQEDNILLESLKEEQEKNAELKETYSNLKKELNFMKKLMREAFIVKGLMSAESSKGKNKLAGLKI